MESGRLEGGGPAQVEGRQSCSEQRQIIVVIKEVRRVSHGFWRHARGDLGGRLSRKTPGCDFVVPKNIAGTSDVYRKSKHSKTPHASVVINSRSHPKSQFIYVNHKKKKGHGAQYHTDSCCKSKGALSLTLSSRPLVAMPSGCRRSGVRTSAAALFTDMPFPNRKALSRGASEDDL